MRVTRRQLLQAGGALASASAAVYATASAAVFATASATASATATATASIAGFPLGGTARAEEPGQRAAAHTAPLGTPLSGKRLTLINLHTAEHLDLEFYRGDGYVTDSLAAIQVLLRDYRNGEQHVIDPKLMDYLFDVAQRIGAPPAFTVISGYRSPRTNAQLRERSSGVAQHSLHMEGRAIDVRLSGVDCAELAAHARDMSRGGVGYYKKSDFVHLDTGAYRTWNG